MGRKNKLEDLNDILFETIENLNDRDIKGDELKVELNRADAISKVASQIISNASLVLKANHLASEHGVTSNITKTALEDKLSAKKGLQ